ncbi:MAG: NAD(P)H-binding protein [Kibdelosporangium sp.]
MSKTILVTGGTGNLGAHLVRLLSQAGHDVRVASRRTGDGLATVDWKTGAGLADAVAGVEVIVHCAGDHRGNDVERRLVAAARQAGTSHLVYISIVGVDRIPFFYYRTKLVGERLIEASGVPWTVLRATQFHDLIRVVLATSARLPVMLVPDLRFQPIEAGEVAERLAVLAAGPPAGRVPDIAGPHVHALRDLARMYLRATGRRRPVVPFGLPGKAFREFKAGHNLAPGQAVGRITFADQLAAHPNRRTVSYRGQR